MSRVLVVVALALALAPALALVAADHVYSHRFVFEGRLVGSDGLPLPGRAVEFFSMGDPIAKGCAASPSTSVTDEWGDFRFCFHVHELRTSTRVGVRVGNVTAVKPMDTGFRRTVVTLHEPNETGVAPEGWEDTHRVAGKAWRAGPLVLEDVYVHGLAVADLPVNLTVIGPAGERVLRTTTDDYGDFDLRVELAENESATDLTLRLEAMGRSQPLRLDPLTHRATAPLYVEPVVAEVAGAFPSATHVARVAAPGSSTPPLGAGLVGVTLLALVGTVYLAQRKK